MGASTIAIRPLQDFQAKVEGGRLFDMGGSTVTTVHDCIKSRTDITQSESVHKNRSPTVHSTLT